MNDKKELKLILVAARNQLSSNDIKSLISYLESDDCDYLYPHLYRKYVNVFENVLCFKTETFFDSKNEQERLLDFFIAY